LLQNWRLVYKSNELLKLKILKKMAKLFSLSIHLKKTKEQKEIQ